MTLIIKCPLHYQFLTLFDIWFLDWRSIFGIFDGENTFFTKCSKNGLVSEKYYFLYYIFLTFPKRSKVKSQKKQSSAQGLLKGEKFCFKYSVFYFWHGESSSTASQKSQDINKVSLLLKDLGPAPWKNL